MVNPLALQSPENMVKKTMIAYVIAILIATVLIGFFAALFLDIRSLTHGTRFETYIAITLMVLLISLGLFINHIFRGFRKAI